MDLQFKKLILIPLLYLCENYPVYNPLYFATIFYTISCGLTILKTSNVIVNFQLCALFTKIQVGVNKHKPSLLLSSQAISAGLQLNLHSQSPQITFPEVRVRTKIFSPTLSCSDASKQTMRIWRYACVKVKLTAFY